MFAKLFKPHPAKPLATLRALRALMKFCEERQYLHPDLENLRTCIHALEQDRHKEAVEAWDKIHFGKDGFADWWPPHSAPDGNYDWTVFESLVERTFRLMTLVKAGKGV